MLIDPLSATLITIFIIAFNVTTTIRKYWQKGYGITLALSLLLNFSVLFFDQIDSILEGFSLTADNLQALLVVGIILAFGASLIAGFPTFAKHRNQILTALFVVFAVSALFALPYDPMFNVFTPRSETYAQFGNSNYFHWVVHVTGKGGISAGNPLSFNATLYTNETTLADYNVDSVGFLFNDSYSYPLTANNESLLTTSVFLLGHIRDNKWSATGQIIYYQAGAFATTVNMHCTAKGNPNYVTIVHGSSPALIQISSEDVTVLAKTNAYLLSLSFAFLSFACLELRVENNRKPSEKA